MCNTQSEFHKLEPFLPQGNQPEAFNFPLELSLSFLLLSFGPVPHLFSKTLSPRACVVL